MAGKKVEELIDGGEQTAQNVRAVLNILLESPYFYKTDDERLFLVLMRHKRAFEGKRSFTDYSLISADYLGFVPKKVLD